MEAVKHRFAVCLEGGSEEVVQVGLIGEIDPRDSGRAGIALILGLAACSINSCGNSS